MDTSSWYQQQSENITLRPKVKFFIGSSDYSNYVSKWPKVVIDGTKVRPAPLGIELSNKDATFNYFVNSKMSMNNICGIELGFDNVNSHSPEYELFYQGYIDNIISNKELIKLKLRDRMRQLSERQVGTKDAPAVFSSTIMLGSDIFWTICTCYGGLDSVASSSNVDIDYAAFQSWASVFSVDTLIMGARYEGVKCNEALSKLARHTHSTIATDGIKISPKRFTVNSVNQGDLNDSNLFGVSMQLNDKNIINRQYVRGLYVPDSNDWTIELFSQNSSSVNSWGLKEDTERDKALWYVDSSGCNNFAQRITSLQDEPNENFDGKAYFGANTLLIGDIITLTNTPMGVQSVTARVMKKVVDLTNGVVNLGLSTTQLFNQFTLDVTSLDGTETLI